MGIALTQQEGIRLLLQGACELAKVQRAGMCVDLETLSQSEKYLNKEIKKTYVEMVKLPEIKYWKKKFGELWSISKDDQLAHVLFDYLKIDSVKQTKSGKRSVDAASLEELAEESELCRYILRIRKLMKAKDTYIADIKRETNDDGLLRPFFHLHLARTFRSSSSSPNFQNIPTRIPEIKKAIRGAMLPRKGRLIGEVDFKGIEVSVAACYHKDPTMIEYLNNSTKDMHRDMACQIYMLDDNEWNSDIRGVAKNKFVFPEFYGSYWKQVSVDLWKAITLHKLTVGHAPDSKKALPNGLSLQKHLMKKGIDSLNDFETHIKNIEDHFWNERFKVYNQWKIDFYNDYIERGYFTTHTGFKIGGYMKRNEVINFPVQGSAFHCLLWTLTQLNQWIQDNKMATCIIGQIHDSVVMDIHPSETEDILYKCCELVQLKLHKAFTWINVPMNVEAELAPIDAPWYMKEEVDLPNLRKIKA